MPRKNSAGDLGHTLSGQASIVLRFRDGIVTCQVTRSNGGGAVGYPTRILGSVGMMHAKKLMSALLREYSAASGGDVIYEQLELIERATDD